MNKLIYFSILVITLSAVSCDDDKATATAPTLGELVLTPSPCLQGDSITAFVTIASEGENCSLFKFTVSYNSTSFSKQKTELSRDSQNRVTFKFTAPNKYNGKLKVSVQGTASMYAGGKPYDTTNTISGDVYIQGKEETE